MEVAHTVLISVMKASPPKTAIDVLRHVKATLLAIKNTTIEPKALLELIQGDLPIPIKSHVASMLIHEDFFEHIWDELIEEPDEGRCHCFSR
jgi:hypothetical protein